MCQSKLDLLFPGFALSAVSWCSGKYCHTEEALNQSINIMAMPDWKPFVMCDWQVQSAVKLNWVGCSMYNIYDQNGHIITGSGQV